MPDVTRSDSQRSDASLRPRVSFNRDVHVKRIVPREGVRTVVGALSGDNKTPLVASPVRKERLSKSKEALKKEASDVLDRADKLDCVVQNSGSHPDKYNTLPVRKKNRTDFPQNSLDRRVRRRNSTDLAVPPKKPPRTFATSTPTTTNTRHRPSIFNLFKKSEPPSNQTPKKSNLRRAVSDATHSRYKSPVNDVSSSTPNKAKTTDNEAKEKQSSLKKKKKQLSPIIEVTPREDYFDTKIGKEEDNKDEAHQEKKLTITEQLKEYIDEVDTALFHETGVRVPPPGSEKKSPPEVVIIDVDKADQISSGKKSKGKSLGQKLKSLTKNKEKNKDKKQEKPTQSKNKKVERSVSVHVSNKKRNTDLRRRHSLEDIEKKKPSISPTIKETIKALNTNQDKMIHSSQKPVDKLPLTKGRTVDTMVKRLSHGSVSPPPRTNIMITPNVTVQHNNNQPFSYTRGHSPDKLDSPKPIIYAQVVCNNSGNPNKQTIHTTYLNGKKNVPHSDSDEGLGTEENSAFNRKYEENRTTTRFGDERYNSSHRRDYYNEDDEFPITPNVKNISYNGFGRYDKFAENYGLRSEQNFFIDSSSRGRADGMDSKRRESLTEQENGLSHMKFDSFNSSGGRNDLSLRRDQLESRITRRFGEKSYRQSPEYSPKPANVYVTETSSKYYRSGSTSPVGYKDKFISETRIDSKGEKHTSETRTRKYFGDGNYEEYNSFENEPKSIDSQISDYRSSPEQNRHLSQSPKDRYTSKKQQISKNKDYYKSNPEIHIKNYDSYKYNDRMDYQETYHDSLKREKHENRYNSDKYRHNERYFDTTDSERKDKFGDSGIENDFRRDSGDNFKVSRSSNKQKRETSNESEDEGFASSLLIASERQHTEDNFNRKRREYGATTTSSSSKHNNRESKERDGEQYRNGHDVIDFQVSGYKSSKGGKYEYAPRERSIDDGSHFDPRIDKDVGGKSTMKRVDKKPPKAEKKSGLEKMKQLFTSSKKKKEKEKNMVREESLRARYTEYRGSREELEPKMKRIDTNELNSAYNYNNRRRLSTPSPSPTREKVRNEKNENTHSSWFKSLDRLSRKKTKKIDKDSNSTEDETPPKSTPTKNLRFFGDTDIESNGSIRKKSSLKTTSRAAFTNNSRERAKSQSTRDLHNISEEMRTPEMRRVTNHKSMLNISESDRDVKGSRLSLKPPASPNHRHRDTPSRSKEDRIRRRKNEVSSVESSTEGDSSQQSQRSVVYLHAATVGDIPGPGYLRNGRRAASREELASNSSSRIQPQVKTLSRSFSVLAPWRPKHYRETLDIDYTQYPKPIRNGKYEQRITKNGSSRKETTSTLKKKAQETKRSNQNVSTLNRRSKSKENVSTLKRSNNETPRGSNSTLYKKKERQPKENNRYNRDDKKMSAKSMSVESLGAGRKSREENREISRSISIPRDPEKSAGWFKTNKKSKKSGSSQRL